MALHLSLQASVLSLGPIGLGKNNKLSSVVVIGCHTTYTNMEDIKRKEMVVQVLGRPGNEQ